MFSTIKILQKNTGEGCKLPLSGGGRGTSSLPGEVRGPAFHETLLMKSQVRGTGERQRDAKGSLDFHPTQGKSAPLPLSREAG